MIGPVQHPSVARLDSDGRVEIPDSIRESSDIEFPAEVFVYDAGDRLVLEPIPSVEGLHGIHAGEAERGDVVAKMREQRADDHRREK